MAKKYVQCPNCGTPMDTKAKVCPKCGLPMKKPLRRRGWFRVLMVLLIIIIVAAIGSSLGSSRKQKNEVITWNTLALADKLPEPSSTLGRVVLDSDHSLSVRLSGWTENNYRDYLTACEESGYNVDSSRSTHLFSAKNAEGYDLSLSYHESDKEVKISLYAPSESSPAGSTDGSQSSGSAAAEDPAASGSAGQAEPDASGSTAQTDPASSGSVAPEDPASSGSGSVSEPAASSQGQEPPANGLRPEFKAAMDSYEAFYDEYVDFMQKYAKNPTDLTLLADYADFMSKAADMDKTFDAWESDNLSTEELAYYIEVNARIQQKLLEVAGATTG